MLFRSGVRSESPVHPHSKSIKSDYRTKYENQLPRTSQTIMTSTNPLNRKVLSSSDGNVVYAEAVGDISKPHLVFVHGFSLSGSVFDKIFHDAKYQEQYFLVTSRCPSQLCFD